jgi:glyoxylase-like metal-dependent hydrolase (beta-lactamase superfamily II)
MRGVFLLGETSMSRRGLALLALAATAFAFAAPALAQTARPQIQTTKVDGTEGVYIFRNGGHQSMFVVTKDGVIATDPIAYGRPSGGQQYVDEIKKVTDKPIKYLIYSHHHFDHIAGGKAFKDAGARIIAHKNVKPHLVATQDPHTVMPDEYFDGTKTIKLGGTTLELIYLGLNHSDSNIVMRLPKEKIVFVVDTIPVGTFPGRGFIDIYPLESETFIKKVMAMDWDRLIPGHPGQPGDRLGTKKDAQDVLTLMQEASAAIKTDAQAGKCWDAVEKDFKMPKYATLPGYEAGLGMVARRYCGLWGRGT